MNKPFVRRFSARGRRVVRKAGEMNGTEAEYGAMLEVRRAAGEIAAYAFEGITLVLARDTRYTPDFAVYLADGTLEFHEVKGGHIRDDAAVKIKVAAEKWWMHRFILAQKKSKRDGGWHIDEVPPLS